MMMAPITHEWHVVDLCSLQPVFQFLIVGPHLSFALTSQGSACSEVYVLILLFVALSSWHRM
jgi:hypothetical protein